MASFMYNLAVKECLDGTINLDTDALKIMLVGSEYTPNQDDDIVDAGGASDAVDAEIDATNYTRGWGGAGRKAATITVSEDDTNNRASVVINDLTWTALGGALNDTVEGAILIKEGGANDTTSRLIAYFDLPTTPTNGSDVTLDFAATGNIQFTT